MAINGALSDEKLLGYLLGELAEEEQRAIEEQYFSSDDAYEELLALESELFFDYTRGNLSQHQRALFERRYLTTPEQKQKLEFVRGILERAAVAKAKSHSGRIFAFLPAGPRKPALRFALVAAVLALVVMSVWLVRQPGREIATQAVRQPASASKPGPAAGAKNQDEAGRTGPPGYNVTTQSAPQPPIIVTLALTPGLVRGNKEMPRLRIPSAAEYVRLELRLPNNRFKSYTVELRTVEGAPILEQKNLPVSRTGLNMAVILRLPASVLATADYEIAVMGEAQSRLPEEVENFYFRVTKE